MVTTVTIQEGDTKASWRTCQSFDEIAKLVSHSIGHYRDETGNPRTLENLYIDASLLGLKELGDFCSENAFRPLACFRADTLNLVLDRLEGKNITEKLLSIDIHPKLKSWLSHLPSHLNDEQKRLVSAVVLACWERVDLHFWVDKDGVARYLLGAEPNYCPLYYTARQLWHIVKCDDDEAHMKEVGDRVYVEAEGKKESFSNWKDACEYVETLCERGRVFGAYTQSDR